MGGWFTQINQIDRIICAYLRNLREIISVTCCERPLAEIADAAEVDDWLTQINQIDRIICAYLRNLREIIFVTCCERSLAESAEIAEAGTSGQDANYLICCICHRSRACGAR